MAGVSRRHGQKVHNLLAATREIGADVRVLVFADADICPEPDWLHTLCFEVVSSRKRTVNTGYRLIVPQRLTLPNLIVYSVNALVAGALGAGKHFSIWGGSWAIRRKQFDDLNIREAWQSTISDDLVATRVVHQAGGRVVFDPRALCLTGFDQGLAGAVEFIQRQFVIGRWYAPGLFWSAFGLFGCTLVTLALLGWNVCGLGWLAPQWATGLLAVVYGAGVFRGILRQSVFFARDSSLVLRYPIAVVFDIFFWPVTVGVSWLVMISAIFRRSICWRGNRYQVDRQGQLPAPNRSSGPNDQRMAA